MTLRVSTGLRNHIAQSGSLKRGLQNGSLLLYSGAQPSSADAAATGTLLARITDNSGALTYEVLPTGSVTLTGGASGSINTVTVDSMNIIPNGAVAYNTSLNQTAADLAAAINAADTNPKYSAKASGAVVTIYGPIGSGTNLNGKTVTATLTTITATYVNMGSGVAGVAPVNGLKFGAAAAGVIAKLATQTWSGLGLANGVVGWFRFAGSVTDAQALDSAGDYLRLDGSVGVSGADANMSNTNVVAGATQTVSSFAVTVPTL